MLFCFLASFPAFAAVFSGRVLDPSGAAVSGVRVVAVGPTGPVAETTTDEQGQYRLHLSPAPGTRLVVTAPGFSRRDTSLAGAAEIRLELAPASDSVTVTGSIIAAPISEQGGSLTLVGRAEIEGRNEAAALDLLRTTPGVAVAQTGHRGGTTSMFVRGGDSKYNLVLIDGVPVSDTRFGGFFEFAHIPSDHLDRIEVIRGPQSAVYGSYANGSVVNFVTRLDETPLAGSLLAEGGTFATRRFAASASAAGRGFRATLGASRLDSEGDVPNQDYRNENLFLNLGRRFARHDLSFRGSFNSSESGAPGPYGSNPVGNFSGLD
ncbi:MAG: TonB-dependent receptor plug domain-containing protein, partial [Bryobacteraceae bacterium]